MSEYYKSKYYSLRREWKEKKKEHDDINILYEGISKQFIINIIKFCEDNNLPDPFEESSSETQNVRGDVSISSFKSLYRKIAVQTHPDKNENKQNARDIYEKATIAKKEGNLQALLDAGKQADISIDLNNISREELNILKENINELQDKINKIKNSYPWVWFNSNPSKRNMIFYDFIESSS